MAMISPGIESLISEQSLPGATFRSLEKLLNHSDEYFLKMLRSSDFVTCMHVPLLLIYRRISNETVSSAEPIGQVNHLRIASKVIETIEDYAKSQIVRDLVSIDAVRTILRRASAPQGNNLFDSMWKNCLELHERLLLSVFEFLEPESESFADVEVDMMDYIYRKISRLPAVYEEMTKSPKWDSETKRSVDTLLREHDRIRDFEGEFQLCMQSLGALRVLVSNLQNCSLGVSSRIFTKYDVLYMLCGLLKMRVWIRKHPVSGAHEKYLNGCWVPYTAEMCQAEASIWMCLLMLLSSEEVRSGAYEFGHTKIEALLKLRKYLSEDVTDQIPPLKDLRRYLEELNVSRSIGSSLHASSGRLKTLNHSLSPFAIVELDETLYDRLLKMEFPIPRFSSDEIRIITKAIAEAYEGLVLSIEERNKTDQSKKPDQSKCKVCSAKGDQRCSKCKAVIYCGASCQIKDWQSHKLVCSVNN